MPADRLPPLRTARPGVASVLALSAAALVACSRGSEPSSAPGTPAASDAPSSAGQGTAGSSPEAPSATVLRVAETDFAIEPAQDGLTAGTYTIEVVNQGQAPHDLVVEDAGGQDVAASEVIRPGESGTVEVDLAPGDYVFYCSVGNHRAMGMEVAVTVR